MKKLLFLSALTVSFMVNSQTNTFPTTGNAGIGTTTPTEELEVVGTIKTDNLIVESQSVSRFVQFGNSVSSIYRNYNFYKSLTNDDIRFNIQSDQDKNVFDLFLTPTNIYMAVREFDQSEIFKVGRNSSVGSFVHLPKTNSRLVIAGLGDYLISDGHKLVVKDGSAMI